MFVNSLQLRHSVLLLFSHLIFFGCHGIEMHFHRSLWMKIRVVSLFGNKSFVLILIAHLNAHNKYVPTLKSVIMFTLIWMDYLDHIHCFPKYHFRGTNKVFDQEDVILFWLVRKERERSLDISEVICQEGKKAKPWRFVGSSCSPPDKSTVGQHSVDSHHNFSPRFPACKKV